MLCAGVSLAGCEKVMQNMYNQPRYKPLAASRLFADGGASRPLVDGVVARSRGFLAGASSGRHGVLPLDTESHQAFPLLGAPPTGTPDLVADLRRLPVPATLANLQRGQRRYEIYCLPCHGRQGDGQGPVVQRGFPAPPSYHGAKLLHAPNEHFFNVITSGYGIMYSYASRVTPEDRWRIVGYIRALQYSERAPVADVPDAERLRLQQSRADPGDATAAATAHPGGVTP